MLHFSKWKILLTVAVLLLGTIYAMPNLFTEEQLSRLPSWVPHQRVSLGLDLQGGSHLLLQVNEEGIVSERLQGLRRDVRNTLANQNAVAPKSGSGVAVDGGKLTGKLPPYSYQMIRVQL